MNDGNEIVIQLKGVDIRPDAETLARLREKRRQAFLAISGERYYYDRDLWRAALKFMESTGDRDGLGKIFMLSVNYGREQWAKGAFLLMGGILTVGFAPALIVPALGYVGVAGPVVASFARSAGPVAASLARNAAGLTATTARSFAQAATTAARVTANATTTAAVTTAYHSAKFGRFAVQAALNSARTVEAAASVASNTVTAAAATTLHKSAEFGRVAWQAYQANTGWRMAINAGTQAALDDEGWRGINYVSVAAEWLPLGFSTWEKRIGTAVNIASPVMEIRLFDTDEKFKLAGYNKGWGETGYDMFIQAATDGIGEKGAPFAKKKLSQVKALNEKWIDNLFLPLSYGGFYAPEQYGAKKVRDKLFPDDDSQ